MRSHPRDFKKSEYGPIVGTPPAPTPVLDALGSVLILDGVASHWDIAYRGSASRPDVRQLRVQRMAAEFLDIQSGTRILELGCGQGWDTLYFAGLGAHVTAIDTSSVAIDQLAGRARDAGLAHRVSSLCMDALDIYTLGTFDAVYGMMILHHIEPFERFVDVLHRTIRPGGRAFFFENSASNPLLMWCRRRLVGRFGIPRFGDADERPLADAEIAALRHHFAVRVDRASEFMLLELIAIYLTRNRWQEALEYLDRQLGRIPLLRHLSYRQLLFLERHSH